MASQRGGVAEVVRGGAFLVTVILLVPGLLLRHVGAVVAGVGAG